MSLLYPTMMRDRLAAVTAEDLKALGAKAVLLDIDNTLTKHHSQEIPQTTRDWIAARQEEGVKLLMVSNSKSVRVGPFAEKIGLPYISVACKPLPFGLRRAVRKLGLPKEACVAIGDQSFTDVLGANLCGIKSIQLMPFEEESGWSFRVRRRLEKGVIRRFREKNGG